jgi:tetratricopeptide (TPR) repeat protein
VLLAGIETFPLPLRRILAGAALALLCTTPALAEASGVRAWQASIQLPTYEEGDPDPSPQFSAFVYRNANYPYPLRTNLTNVRKEKAWRTLNLENEYLLCRVLPDLGGHLYSCRDKLSGREMFYANPVIRKALIGLRGAWVALGIESNFPAAHARHSAAPVDFALRTESDGSARAVVQDTDRVSGMEWRVEYVLRPASTVLEQRVTLYNRGGARRGYDWWANAAIEFDDPATLFILPARLVADHASTVIESWPVTSQGTDESSVAGHKRSTSWFGRGSREPFFAVYKPGSRTGVAHFADPQVVAGKKLYVWGEGGDANVRSALTDNFSSYVEIQGGLFQDQETFQFLEPGRSRTFSEYWIPIRDMGGVSRVTGDALVNLERRTDPKNGPVLLLEVSATHAIGGATIRVFRAGQPGFEARADLDPAAIFTRVLEAPGPAPYTVQLADSRGSILLEHTEDRYDAEGLEGVTLGKQPPPAAYKTGTEADRLENGASSELAECLRSALYEYRTGLEQFPDSIPLQKALGRLDVVLNRFEESAKLLERVHAAAPDDDETSYYLGVAQAMLGRDADACGAFAQVRSTSPFAEPSAIQLAFIAARAGQYSASLSALGPSLSERAGIARPGALEIALLRHAGRQKEAEAEVAVWQAIDPADSMLRFERTLLVADDPELWTHFAADSERSLNLVDDYLNLGLYEDALRLLAHPYPPAPPETIEPGAVPPAESPLFLYYRAYCRSRLGQDPAEDLRAAAAASTRYAFPFRPSSMAVLKFALQANPSDVVARLLLGRLFLHALMVDEAIAEWQQARALNPRLPDLYRDLGKVLIDVRKDSVGGLLVLREGLKADPANPELLAEMARFDRTSVPAPPPAKPAALPEAVRATPAEVAAAAMLKAASGGAEDAASLFNPRVFSAAKQPEGVRRAYIEVQLQRLVAQAAAGTCSSLSFRIDQLGAEDRNIPFTFYGFGSLTKAAHFQFYLAKAEELCRQEQDSRKRWMRIARTNESLPSPEFVFPLLAAWKLNPEDAGPRIAAALESVRVALAGAQESSRPALVYAEGVLLKAQGRDEPAAARLQEALKTAQDVSLKYLAMLQLSEILARGAPQ